MPGITDQTCVAQSCRVCPPDKGSQQAELLAQVPEVIVHLWIAGLRMGKL